MQETDPGEHRVPGTAEGRNHRADREEMERTETKEENPACQMLQGRRAHMDL